MPAVAIAASTLLYVWAATGFIARKDWPMAVVYSGYAFANVGMIWYAIKTAAAK